MAVSIHSRPGIPLLAALAVFAGCNGVDPVAKLGAIQPAVALSGATDFQLTPGETTAVTATIDWIGPHSGGFTLQALFTAVTDQVSATPTSQTVELGTDVVSILVSAAQHAQTGSHALVISASGPGFDHAVTAMVTVNRADPGDLVVSTSPSATAKRRTTLELSVAVTRPTGVDGDVLLRLSGLPAGVTAAATTLGGAATQATLAVVVGAAAPIGPHDIILDAELGEFSASKEIALGIDPGSGEIDPRFGNQGFVELPLLWAPARAVALQARGRLIAAEPFGRGFIVHGFRAADGQPDDGFGTAGTTVVMPAVATDQFTVADIELTTSDDIYLVGMVFHKISGSGCDNGSNDCDGLAVRLTADGELDTAFSGDGITAVNLNCYVRGDRFDGATVLGDGSLVAVGCEDFAIARILPNGNVALGFPFDAYTDNGNSRVNPNAIDVYSPDATSFIAYRYYINNHHFVRYTTAGTLLADYGNGGLFKVTRIGGGGLKGDPLVKSDGTAIVASSVPPEISAYAFSATGAVATTYGIDGTWSTQQPDPYNLRSAYAVAGMANGDIVLAGAYSDGVDSLPMLARFSPAGVFASEFAGGRLGTSLVPPGKAYGLAMKSFELGDGSLLVVIEAWDAVGNNDGFHLTRILP